MTPRRNSVMGMKPWRPLGKTAISDPPTGVDCLNDEGQHPCIMLELLATAVVAICTQALCSLIPTAGLCCPQLVSTPSQAETALRACDRGPWRVAMVLGARLFLKDWKH